MDWTEPYRQTQRGQTIYIEPHIRGNLFAAGRTVYPFADGQGWGILGDATHRQFPTEYEAAEEIVRQYEAMRSEAQR